MKGERKTRDRRQDGKLVASRDQTAEYGVNGAGGGSSAGPPVSGALGLCRKKQRVGTPVWESYRRKGEKLWSLERETGRKGGGAAGELSSGGSRLPDEVSVGGDLPPARAGVVDGENHLARLLGGVGVVDGILSGGEALRLRDGDAVAAGVGGGELGAVVHLPPAYHQVPRYGGASLDKPKTNPSQGRTLIASKLWENSA